MNLSTSSLTTSTSHLYAKDGVFWRTQHLVLFFSSWHFDIFYSTRHTFSYSYTQLSREILRFPIIFPYLQLSAFSLSYYTNKVLLALLFWRLEIGD